MDDGRTCRMSMFERSPQSPTLGTNRPFYCFLPPPRAVGLCTPSHGNASAKRARLAFESFRSVRVRVLRETQTLVELPNLKLVAEPQGSGLRCCCYITAERDGILIRCIVQRGREQRFLGSDLLESTSGLQGMESKDSPLPEEDGAAKEATRRGHKPFDHPFSLGQPGSKWSRSPNRPAKTRTADSPR